MFKNHQLDIIETKIHRCNFWHKKKMLKLYPTSSTARAVLKLQEEENGCESREKCHSERERERASPPAVHRRVV